MQLANPANALMIQINARAAAWMQRRMFSFHKARRMRRKQGFKIALHIKKVNQTRCGTPLFFPYRSVSEGAPLQIIARAPLCGSGYGATHEPDFRKAYCAAQNSAERSGLIDARALHCPQDRVPSAHPQS